MILLLQRDFFELFRQLRVLWRQPPGSLSAPLQLDSHWDGLRSFLSQLRGAAALAHTAPVCRLNSRLYSVYDNGTLSDFVSVSQ